MQVSIYKAGCGDAARLSFIDGEGKKRNIFVDSGYERTYRDILHEEIKGISSSGEMIDLWIISHIHDDHIGGVINYINAINKGFQTDVVIRWLYNSPRKEILQLQQNAFSNTASIRQGDKLLEYLSVIKKIPETVTNKTQPIDFGGFKITFLSPGKLQLENLYNKYKAIFTQFEKNEEEYGSIAMGTKIRDYHFKADEFDLSKVKEDENVDNGSSIAFITEFDSHKMLWLADAHPMVIVQSLKEIGYSQECPIICNYVKISHHGSSSNNTSELFNLIKCENFIISVNGNNKHNLPNKESLIRILKNVNRDIFQKINFFFTYDDPILRSIFAIDGESIYQTLNFEMHYCNLYSLILDFS